MYANENTAKELSNMYANNYMLNRYKSIHASDLQPTIHSLQRRRDWEKKTTFVAETLGYGMHKKKGKVSNSIVRTLFTI